jgi:predicted Na+-dependent transporter
MAQLLVPITLFAIMFALGLGIRSDAIDMLQRRRWLVLRVLLGTCLLVPLVALLLLKLPAARALSPAVRFGIALMALCPSAPLTLRKAGKKGGDRDLAALLQVGAAIAAIVSIPLVADLFRAAFAIQGWDIAPGAVARQVGHSQLLPLVLGLGLRRLRPGLADCLEGPLGRLADLLLLILVVVVLALMAPLLVPFVATEAVALGFMALLVVAALAIGYVLSGPAEEERTTVALVTSMRNPGLALLFAGLYAASMPSIKLAVIVYLLMTVIVSVPFLQWRRHLARRHRDLAGG